MCQLCIVRAQYSEPPMNVSQTSVNLNTKRLILIQPCLTERDATAAPVVKSCHKPAKQATDLLYGFYTLTMGAQTAMVAYEHDPDLRYSINAFMRREILLHLPDACVVKDTTKIDYEVSVARYFYKPQAIRTLEEIRSLKQETDGLLVGILGEGVS